MAMLVVSRDARMFNVCKSRDVMQTQGLKLHHFRQCRKAFRCWHQDIAFQRLGPQCASACLAYLSSLPCSLSPRKHSHGFPLFILPGCFISLYRTP